MRYSKLKTLRVKNFRSIGDVTIDFTESPIIVLTGDNEAGKTSIVKAFAVLATNDNPRGQKDFIRDGSNGFGIAADLEDGTTVVRIKTPQLNRYELSKPGEDDWVTNKIDDGGDVPYPIVQVMGIVKEPETKELLHIRTYEDNLLFVVTNASTNYKVMYNALKVEQLTNAIGLGSEEANRLRNNINTNDIAIKTLLDNLRKIKVHDTEAVSNIKDRVAGQLHTLDKISRAMEIKGNIKKIEKDLEISRQLSEAKEISLDICRKLNNYSKLSKDIDRLGKLIYMYEDSFKLKEIDASIELKLYRAMNRKTAIEVYQEELEKYNDIQGIDKINTDIISRVYRANELNNYVNILRSKLSKMNMQDVFEVTDLQLSVVDKSRKMMDYIESVKSLENSLGELEKEKDRLNEIIIESGAIVAECNNCGSSVVVDARAYV